LTARWEGSIVGGADPGWVTDGGESIALSKIGLIQRLVENGLYYLTEHAYDEAIADGFDIFDVENRLLTGQTRRTWPREGKK
jgi:hypothetical protein